MAKTHPFLVAMRPVAKALGASIVPVRKMQDSDIPLRWEGELVGGLRMPDRAVASGALIAQVERKQRAVRLLEERGAFQIRKSIEDVADALGVSRITVYNYLNAIRDRAASDGARTK